MPRLSDTIAGISAAVSPSWSGNRLRVSSRWAQPRRTTGVAMAKAEPQWFV
jgi:hypothetical protein